MTTRRLINTLTVIAATAGCYASTIAWAGEAGSERGNKIPVVQEAAWKGFDLCSLVTPSEVSALVGKPVPLGHARDHIGIMHTSYDCDFQAKGVPLGYELYLVTFDQMIMNALLDDSMGAYQRIQGIGDFAAWDSHYSQLYVQKGRRALMIVFKLNPLLSQLTPAAANVAKLIANRM